MSFYGTIYHQISDAFSEFFIKNSGVNNNDFLSNTTSSMNIEADGRAGKLSIDSGNAWIQLEGSAGTQDSPEDNICKIYHSKPDTNNLTTNKVFEEASSVPSEKELIEVDLSTNKYLKINNIKYDKAGHISESGDTYLYFKQVNAAKELDEMRDDIDKFKSDVNAELDNFDKRLIDQEQFEQRVKDLENLKAGEAINFIGTTTDFTNKKTVTLCNGIGNIDYLRNNGKNGSTVVLKESVSDLGSEDTLCDYINALKSDLIFLKGKIVDLEKQIANT